MTNYKEQCEAKLGPVLRFFVWFLRPVVSVVIEEYRRRDEVATARLWKSYPELLKAAYQPSIKRPSVTSI